MYRIIIENTCEEYIYTFRQDMRSKVKAAELAVELNRLFAITGQRLVALVKSEGE